MGTLSAKVPEWAELQRKTGQRGLLITSYQKFKKKNNNKKNTSDRAITPVAEAVLVSAHLSSCATFTLNPH